MTTNSLLAAMQPLQNRSAQIVIAESMESLRPAISEALRSLGFSKITSLGGLQDTLAYLETDNVDLIICGLFKEERANLLSTMKLCAATPALRHVQFVAMAEESEKDVLLTAYELGLLAHIFKPFSGDKARTAFTKLFNDLQGCEWDSTLAAVDYVRPLLRTKDDSALLQLATRMCSQYPERYSFLIDLAEAQLRMGDEGLARSTLWQACMLDQSLATPANTLLKELLGPEGGPPIERKEFNLKKAGVKACVVVDADMTVRNLLVTTLREQNVEHVEAFENGRLCWEWLKANPSPDLMIQEWRLPELSGAALLQRIKSSESNQTQVIVASSLVKRSDHQLLSEMGVDLTLEKPFGKNELVNSIVWLIKQDRYGATRTAIESKIRRLLRAGNMAEAKRWKLQLMSRSDFPAPAQKRLDAEFAFYDGQYLEARNLVLESLKFDRDDPHALNLAAKCLFKLRDFAAALKFFEKAKHYSPGNIERLCLMAEAKLEMDDVKGATAELDQAAMLDADNPKVKETQAMAELKKGNPSGCRDLLQTLDSIATFVGFANNHAVALAASDRLPEATTIYRTCLESLAPAEIGYRGSISYNLALALCRQEKLQEAHDILVAIDLLGLDTLRPKVLSLTKRVKHSLQTGDRLQMFLASPVIIAVEEETGEPTAEVVDEALNEVLSDKKSVKKVDAPQHKCCQGLFKLSKIEEATTAMLALKPMFTKRDAIKKV